MAKRVREYRINDFISKFVYDANGNITNKKYLLGDKKYIIDNIYNQIDYLSKINYGDGNYIDYQYDSLGRIIQCNINDNMKTKYNYIKNGDRNTLLLKDITNNENKLSYKYNKLGYITHIYYNDSIQHRYYYDDYNQLIREDNYKIDRTFRYKYDSSGNILFKREYEINTYNLITYQRFQYSNNNWKDQLSKIDNQSIVYDSYGNPTKIDNKELVWINGCELKSYQDSDVNVEFKYDVESIRNCKIVNGIITKFYCINKKIVLETTNNNVIYYGRDNDGNLVGFVYNDTNYFYEKNGQGDIISIKDNNNVVVAKYEYDAWGNILSVTDSEGNDVSANLSHIANINPFRYRSYYYDKETMLYYLGNRYYNPSWGRFINTDNIICANKDLISYNLYCYCSNNSISLIDANGNFALAGSLMKVAITVVAAVVVACVAPKALKQTRRATINTDFGVRASLAVASIKERTQSTVQAIARQLTDATKKIISDYKTKEKKEGNCAVYALGYKTTPPDVVYVGRTCDLDSRLAAHSSKGPRVGLKPLYTVEGLTYEKSRALEQTWIMEFKTLNASLESLRHAAENHINGISMYRKDCHELMRAVEDYYGETYVGHCK